MDAWMSKVDLQYTSSLEETVSKTRYMDTDQGDLNFEILWIRQQNF